MPETLRQSAAMAIFALWLAARAGSRPLWDAPGEAAPGPVRLIPVPAPEIYADAVARAERLLRAEAGLPQGLRTKYLPKSTGGLTAKATAELPDFSQITKESGGQTVTVTIHYTDAAGKEPVYAEIDIWVTAKK